MITSSLDEIVTVATEIKISGINNYLGMFTVDCLGCEEKVIKYETIQNDQSIIMVQALTSRLVEPYAEVVHHNIRVHLEIFTI